MRKFLTSVCFVAAVCTALGSLCGCFKKVNYLDYVSEKRTNIYLYEDDGVSVKIYCSEREQPYCADGIKGETTDICELFVSLPKTYETVDVSVESLGGEMNYQSVENRYYLSFSAKDFGKDSVDVTLTFDGESKTYPALSLKDGNVFDCDRAVNCVVEYDRELFENLTENRLFSGEIYVRLLYDEGCYYYVGVCDRNKHITAYLLDGEKGKIIAKKEMQG